MNDQLNSINTITQPSSTGCPVAQVCGSRLPCGVCLITNQKCPLSMPTYPTITITSTNDITCATSQEGKTNSTETKADFNYMGYGL